MVTLVKHSMIESLSKTKEGCSLRPVLFVIAEAEPAERMFELDYLFLNGVSFVIIYIS